MCGDNKIAVQMKAWLSLLRFPNLFTVPGDAIFGYLVAKGDTGSANLIYVVGAVLSCYMFGLVTNDIADMETDLKERPSRPIPSGQVSPVAARFAAMLLFIVAIGLSVPCGIKTAIGCVILLALISSYNFMFKNVFIIGPAILAICRLLGLMLGLFAANSIELTSSLLYPMMIFLTLYVFGLSVSAQVETEEGRKRTVLSGAWLIMIGSVLWIGAGVFLSTKVDLISVMDEITPSILFAIILSSVVCLITLKNLVMLHMKYSPSMVPPIIGESIRNLILIQASACAFAGFLNESFLVALLIVPAWFFSQMYYQS